MGRPLLMAAAFLLAVAIIVALVYATISNNPIHPPPAPTPSINLQLPTL